MALAWIVCSNPGKRLPNMELNDPFAARMVAQLRLIERYRTAVLRREGRRLDSETAALEWITRYAARFPPIEHYARQRPSTPAPASLGNNAWSCRDNAA
ncbi:MAG: hypothetical protein JNK99_14360 [Candidatus Accumulibacter sp.]|jgi:hypothetical protein|uniref:hypothetical protein n=1 Tax=Accumulibacter sp. TaxID=2053492 RepID=UPI001A4DD6AA|nr:hypothetical protein [Accumulibacter sp.]MBL8395905.1 hypothetical protein [Accumulibacter sp.]